VITLVPPSPPADTGGSMPMWMVGAIIGGVVAFVLLVVAPLVYCFLCSGTRQKSSSLAGMYSKRRSEALVKTYMGESGGVGSKSLGYVESDRAPGPKSPSRFGGRAKVAYGEMRDEKTSSPVYRNEMIVAKEPVGFSGAI